MKQNVFMEDFKKRLVKGLLVGGAMILFMIVASVASGESVFSSLPWYLVPVVLIITMLYGTGWYFAFNLIKRAWRKFLRVNRNATIWQALTGRGLLMGIVYSMLCLVLGCFLALFVGNFFMAWDYVLAKKAMPPVSVKYKFDSDLEYNSWVNEMSAIRGAVKYSDDVNNANANRRFENERNLQNIEEGNLGTVRTTINEGGKKINVNTKID